MATVAEIQALRNNINEHVNADPYTDLYLSALIDESGSVEEATVAVWQHKAASYAEMTDVTEAGASIKQSQLHDNALKMIAYWKGVIDGPAEPSVGRAKTHRIFR